MAQIPIQQTAFFNLPISVKRLNPRPLDESSVWDSLEDAQIYAQSSPTAHVGQILSIIDSTSKDVKVLVIKDTDGNLKPIGGSDGGDLNITGTLSVTGDSIFDNAIHIINGEYRNSLYTDEGGVLQIDGNAVFNSHVTINNGFSLGNEDKPLFYSKDIDGDVCINVDTFLNFNNNTGINFLGNNALKFSNNKTSLSAYNGTLIIGENTSKISLQSDIYDTKETTCVLSKYGDGCFLNSFKAGYNQSEPLLYTFYKADDNCGIVVPYKLKFGNEISGYLSAKNGKICFTDKLLLVNNQETQEQEINSSLQYIISESEYANQSHVSSAFYLNTDSDFFQFNKAIESDISIGIAKSKTRLTNGILFFNDNAYLSAISDGIKLYGNGYFNSDISSIGFSSGFAGSKWGIITNVSTGNTVATFDEIVVRKKIRSYELEVQSFKSSNGALWVSDSCSGDTVIEII